MENSGSLFLSRRFLPMFAAQFLSALCDNLFRNGILVLVTFGLAEKAGYNGKIVTSIALGLFISFTGILTFKNSDALRAIAAELPADRILVETDAPYLAPKLFRGKRNEPAYVVETAKVLAETRGVSLDQIAEQTTANFFRLFGKVPRPAAAAA